MKCVIYFSIFFISKIINLWGADFGPHNNSFHKDPFFLIAHNVINSFDGIKNYYNMCLVHKSWYNLIINSHLKNEAIYLKYNQQRTKNNLNFLSQIPIIKNHLKDKNLSNFQSIWNSLDDLFSIEQNREKLLFQAIKSENNHLFSIILDTFLLGKSNCLKFGKKFYLVGLTSNLHFYVKVFKNLSVDDKLTWIFYTYDIKAINFLIQKAYSWFYDDFIRLLKGLRNYILPNISLIQHHLSCYCGKCHLINEIFESSNNHLINTFIGKLADPSQDTYEYHLLFVNELILFFNLCKKIKLNLGYDTNRRSNGLHGIGNKGYNMLGLAIVQRNFTSINIICTYFPLFLRVNVAPNMDLFQLAHYLNYSDEEFEILHNCTHLIKSK